MSTILIRSQELGLANLRARLPLCTCHWQATVRQE